MAGDPPDGSEGIGQVEPVAESDGRSPQAVEVLLWGRVAVATVGAVLVGVVGGWITHEAWAKSGLPIVQEVIATGVVGAAVWVLAQATKVPARVVDWVLGRRPIRADRSGRRVEPHSPTRWKELVRQISIVGLALAAGAVTFVVLNGDIGPDACGRTPPEDAVEVVVVWVDTELDAFCTVVDRYDEDVEVVSAGEDIGSYLEGRFGAGHPPDVAIVPQPSLVQRLGDDCDRLARLNSLPAIDHAREERQGIPALWTDLVATGSGGEKEVWGAFVKGANKSIFWYLTDELPNEPDPRHGWEWSFFTEWIGRYTRQSEDGSGPAPLTLAAGDRWPLTDWFENHLAMLDFQLYQRFARGEQVEWHSGSQDYSTLHDALEQMAHLWRDQDVFPAGGHDPATTRLGALDDRLRERDAALVFAPSFLAAQIDDDQRPDRDLYPHDVRAFRFPGLRRQHLVVVGGDIAVVPTQAESEAPGRDFVTWLTSSTAMAIWSEADQGYLAPNWSSPQAEPSQGDSEDNSDDLRELLTDQLLAYGTPGSDYELLFDLSDDQFATRDEDDPRVTWEIFGQFFEDITHRTVEEEVAIERVIDGLHDEYTNPPPDCQE